MNASSIFSAVISAISAIGSAIIALIGAIKRK